MSVVNQMLRDLQDQQQANKPLNMQAVNNSSSNAIVWVIVFVLLSVSGIVAWQWGFHSNETSTLDKRLVADSHSQVNSQDTKQSSKRPQTNTSQLTAQIDSNKVEIKPTESTTLESKAVEPMTIEPQTLIKDSAKISQSTSLPTQQSDIATTKAIANSNTKPTVVEKEVNSSDKGSHTEQQSISTAQASDSQNVIVTKPVIKQSKETIELKQLQEIKNDSRFESYAETEVRVNKLLEKNKNFHQARLFLINQAIKKQPPQLNQLLEKSVAQFPKVSAYQLVAARFYFQSNQLEKTESFLAQVTADMNQANQLLQIRALTRQKLNKHQLAIRDYSSILQREPNRGDIYLAIGISFDAIGDLAQAKRSFQNALSDRRLNKRQAQFAESKINQYQG